MLTTRYVLLSHGYNSYNSLLWITFPKEGYYNSE